MVSVPQSIPLKKKPHLGDDPWDSLSSLLKELGEGPPGPITVGEMIDHFGRRAFGAALFVFSAPNLLPLPPGSSTILGLPLLLIAPQLALGVRRPWLPKALARRSVDREVLTRAFARLIPSLQKVERLTAPRLSLLFGPIGDRLIGVVCTLLVLVLILPIPLGNMLPASAIAALGLSLVQRDGALALAGYLLAALSVTVLVLSAGAAVAAAHHLFGVFGL